MNSGPLFVERMFYLKNMKEKGILTFLWYEKAKHSLTIFLLSILCKDVEHWISKKKLLDLPLPKFYGFGSAEYNSNQYRFIVIEKFDKDLEEFLKTVPNRLLLGAVINIIRQIVSSCTIILSHN